VAKKEEQTNGKSVTVKVTPVAAAVGPEGVTLVCIGEVVDPGKKSYKGWGQGQWGKKNGGGSTPSA
jgi:hypothetical protein